MNLPEPKQRSKAYFNYIGEVNGKLSRVKEKRKNEKILEEMENNRQLF